jgi:hypothetical protein
MTLIVMDSQLLDTVLSQETYKNKLENNTSNKDLWAS